VHPSVSQKPKALGGELSAALRQCASIAVMVKILVEGSCRHAFVPDSALLQVTRTLKGFLVALQSGHDMA
jgi:hypothetical protein